MTDVDEHGRPEPPPAGSEMELLLGFLDFHRATFAWKCRGLDAAALNATVGTSTMPLGRMRKHLAVVEEAWFSQSLRGRELGPPWNDVDWDADRDWEWHTAADDTPEELFALWERGVATARESVAEALDNGGGLDQLAAREWADGRA